MRMYPVPPPLNLVALAWDLIARIVVKLIFCMRCCGLAKPSVRHTAHTSHTTRTPCSLPAPYAASVTEYACRLFSNGGPCDGRSRRKKT